MKIIVTGATGFIGSHLAERLRREGHELVCVAKDPLNAQVLESAGCKVVIADLNNDAGWEQLLGDAEMVYHLAGVVRARHTRDYYEGNVLGTKHVLEACLKYASRLKRLVYVSSLTASGPSTDGKPLSEDVPYHPVSDYGRSKMLAEQEILKIGDRIPWTIVRPAAVYGPRERDWFDYICIIRRGIEPLIGFRDKMLSILYIDDVVDGIIRAAESEHAVGRTYFLGSEEPCSYHTLGMTISRVLKCHPVCVRLPHTLVFAVAACAAAAGALTGKEVLFNIQKARESVQRGWVCSVERARRELGWHQQVGLEEGLSRTCEWYVRYGWL